MSIKIVPKDEQMSGRYFRKDKNEYNILFDQNKIINIRYHILNISLHKGVDTKFPKCCGAYVITTNSGNLYIGSTANISKRLKRHISEQKIRINPNIYEEVNKVDVYATETPIDGKILEYCLIKELSPQLNLEFIPKKRT